jgi:anti-sigma B factor antagonist
MSKSAVTVVERHPNVVVVHVQAERLDETNLSTVRADASAAGAESPQAAVVLDMARVGFMPSLSLGGLIQLSQAFKVRGQRLVLAGLQPAVRETMAITRLDRLFEIHDDLTTLPGATGPAR